MRTFKVGDRVFYVKYRDHEKTMEIKARGTVVNLLEDRCYNVDMREWDNIYMCHEDNLVLVSALPKFD